MLLSSDSNLYVRPTAGGNAGAAPAAIPTQGQINRPGNSPSEGGTQAGPDMGHGATQILSGISGGGDTDNDGDTL
jgi:hypothetical protein